MKKKAKGDHSILGALILTIVAVMAGVFIFSMVKKAGPENAEAYTNRTTNVMHSDGNRITNFE